MHMIYMFDWQQTTVLHKQRIPAVIG